MQVRRIFCAGRYANVTATVALVAALGGTSYAATTFIRPNSVGMRQLKDGAVTSAKVKDHSLVAADFKRGQLPKGRQGDRGPSGVAGPAGLAGPKGVAGDVGPAGPKGAQGNKGEPGVVAGFSAATVSVAFGDADTLKTIQTLTLPEGKYIITARTMAHNTEGSSSSLDCTLEAGGTVIDSTGAGDEIAAAGALDTSVSLNGAATMAAGDAALVCQTSSVAGSYTEPHITAIALTTLNGS
jgi:hypothetical protein